MKTNKSSKRALLISICAITICAVMLIGTTFAWFTDTASTAVNTIQSGTLDLVLEMWDSAEGKWVSAEGKTLSFIKSADAPAGEELLWEPGCTYVLPELRIRNNGKLALKYKVTVNGATGDTKLLEAIDFTVKKNGANEGEKLEGWEGHLLPTGTPATDSEPNVIQFAISGHMKEAAGNEYQGLTLNGIGLTVVATQYTYEYDSNDNQYDKFADYPEIQPITSADQLKEVLANDDVDGKTLKLYDDITADDLEITKDVALDLNGNTMDTSRIQVNGSTIVIGDSSENGDGKIMTSDSYGVINAVNSDVTITGGSFVSSYDKTGSSGYASVIQARNSNLTIDGGHFENTESVGGYNYIIKAPSYSKTEKTTITINGGEFVSHRDYGYIVTGDSDANVDVTINDGKFKTEGRNSYLTNVKGSVIVNNCEFTATGNNAVFNIPADSTVTVKGGTFSVNENSYTDTSLAGLIFHRKTNGWTSVYGTLLVDPITAVKVNQPTYSGFIAAGATQSAKGADGFYTISK